MAKGESLFDGYLTNYSWSPEEMYCSCGEDSSSSCSPMALSSDEFIFDEHLEPVLQRIPATSSYLHQEYPGTYDSDKFSFADMNRTSYIESVAQWTTVTNITEQEARSHCYQVIYIDSSPVLQTYCYFALNNMYGESISMSTCMLDIQV